MTLIDLRKLLAAEAVRGRRALERARRARDERKIGYWSCYIEDRERILVILADMVDERER